MIQLQIEMSRDAAARLYALLGEIDGDDGGLYELYASLHRLLRAEEREAYDVDVSAETEAPIVIRPAKLPQDSEDRA